MRSTIATHGYRPFSRLGIATQGYRVATPIALLPLCPPTLSLRHGGIQISPARSIDVSIGQVAVASIELRFSTKIDVGIDEVRESSPTLNVRCCDE